METLCDAGGTVRVVDISVPIRSQMPVWPGDPPVRLDRVQDLGRGDPVTLTSLTMGAHTGTHVDAPAHFLPEGKTVDEIGLEDLVGPAWVVDVGRAPLIHRPLLEGAGIPSSARRILFRTANSTRGILFRPFNPDYVSLSPCAAQWLVERGVRLVGLDAFSVGSVDTGSQTHQILMAANVIILEGITLREVEQGLWFLVCLPLNLVAAEGAPARAVLLRGAPWA